MSSTALRRHELAAFLRSRRERITPEDAGLPSGHRRRTAGLRREEVAQLSGVGVTWYTWLEQGRPIRASVQVLEAVARTLQLDTIERQHLFRLAEVPDTTHPVESGPLLPPQIQVVLDGLSPIPASVVTDRFDSPPWNAAYQLFLPPLGQAYPAARPPMVRVPPDNGATDPAVEPPVRGRVQPHLPCWPDPQARTRELLTV